MTFAFLSNNKDKRMFFRKKQNTSQVLSQTTMGNVEQIHIVKSDSSFPTGSHVFGITTGPQGEIMVGAGHPLTGEGSIFLRETSGTWTQINLPDETAWLSQFVRLIDGSYVASGMSLIGRAAILKSDTTGRNWKSVDMDLHAYSQINTLIDRKSVV